MLGGAIGCSERLSGAVTASQATASRNRKRMPAAM
jgi:hypothetical protein